MNNDDIVWVLAWLDYLSAVTLILASFCFTLYCWNRYLKIPKWLIVALVFSGGIG